MNFSIYFDIYQYYNGWPCYNPARVSGGEHLALWGGVFGVRVRGGVDVFLGPWLARGMAVSVTWYGWLVAASRDL